MFVSHFPHLVWFLDKKGWLKLEFATGAIRVWKERDRAPFYLPRDNGFSQNSPALENYLGSPFPHSFLGVPASLHLCNYYLWEEWHLKGSGSSFIILTIWLFILQLGPTTNHPLYFSWTPVLFINSDRITPQRTPDPASFSAVHPSLLNSDFLDVGKPPLSWLWIPNTTGSLT